MRIMVGLTDVANVTSGLAKGFRALGHEVFSVVWSKSEFYPEVNYDVVVDDRIQRTGFGGTGRRYLGMAARAASVLRALNCDLFVLYAPAVLPTHLYYPFLKSLGKKLVTVFWGSDVRYWYAFGEEMQKLGVYEQMAPVVRYMRERSGGSYFDKLRTVRAAEKYSDLVLSQPDCSQLLTRPYMRATIPLDLSQYEFNVPGRRRPLVLHAPSVPEAKGTDVIVKIVNELQAEGLQFDFRLIQGMPNRALRQLLADADILVDELYSATVAGLSAEGMATGNAVLVRYMVDYCKVPSPCPAVNVNQFTLKENLRQIILNVDRRRQLAIDGRRYVEGANDHIRIARDLLNWIDQVGGLDYDFHPTFYRDFHVPPDLLEQEKKDTIKRRAEFFKLLLTTGATRKRPSGSGRIERIQS